jgi:two-component system sensor histidine kinase ChiS
MSVTDPATSAVSCDLRAAALEAELHEARRELAELRSRDALKTQFLANISHDLRTPLTAIITHAEILRDGILGPLPARQANSVNGIIAGGRQLLDMVGEILTYAKATADRLRTVRTEFALADVVHQVFELNQAVAARKGVLCSTDVPASLPPVYADRDKVMHILTNLLGNAIDFTAPGKRVWIRAWFERTDDGVDPGHHVIEVGDEGIGIAPEHQQLIFDEFAQVDSSASRQHHGTGLGLTIARRFVELHGGDIWLESEVGVGTRFYFTIPHATPQSTHAAAPSAHR